MYKIIKKKRGRTSTVGRISFSPQSDYLSLDWALNKQGTQILYFPHLLSTRLQKLRSFPSPSISEANVPVVCDHSFMKPVFILPWHNREPVWYSAQKVRVGVGNPGPNPHTAMKLMR